jgi:hypothetical protein
MRTTSWLLAVLVLLALSLPAWAGDIVDMPTGNMLKANHCEFNYIYWDLDNPPGPAPDHAHIFKAFLGITDRLEVDVTVMDLQNVDTFTSVNAYLQVGRESETWGSLIVGATNLLGSKWPTDDRVSPFIMSAYNFMTPQGGPPSFKNPLLRGHLGYGSRYHDGFYGGVQALIHPKVGFAVLNYQHQPSYLMTVSPRRSLEVTVGTKNGDPLVRLGYFGSW